MKPNWFVAIPVAAGAWFERVGMPPSGVRLFHPDDLHLTVAFLGGVEESAARAAFEQARAIALVPLTLRLGKVVPMGNPRRPSALSARITEGEQALSLAMTTIRDPVCDAAHAARETRPSLPHLTLARPQRTATQSERAAALRWAAGLDLGEPAVTLHEVALYTWSSKRRERLFDIVDRFALVP